MKQLQFAFAIFFTLTIMFNGHGQNNETSTKLLGEISKNDLTSLPYATWFNSEFDAYLPNAKTISEITNELSQYSILVFMGTWCGDSKKEVPRFYKLLEAANYPMHQLKVIAVDNERSNYKKSPTGEEKGLNIHRVPTFIFYKDGKEVNRIIEHPIESLELDIKNILTSNTYTPNYYAIEILQKLLNDPKQTQSQIAEQLKTIVTSETELNGLGYLYLNNKEFDKAITVFTINKLLFPNNFNTYDSLAEAYDNSGQKDQALKNYELAFALIQQNPIIVQLKNKIEKLKNN